MNTAPDTSQINVASLYVGDLKSEVTEQVLWNIFSPYGQVLSIKVCRDSHSHASLGYAYVNFRTNQEAEKALESVNFSVIDGKPCRVMWSMRDPNRRKLGIGNLFIKNIDPLLDSKSLFQAFSAFGPVMSCKIAFDDYGLSKGYGFIQFYSEKDAEKAIARSDGVYFMKKKLVVTKFIPKSARTDAKPVNPNDFTNVFVKNFGVEWTLNDLRQTFAKFGEITSCVIQRGENDKSLGYGFVNFSAPQDAAEAVKQMNGLELPTGLRLFADRAMKKLERQAFLKKQHEDRKKEFYKQYQNLNLYVKNFEESVTDEKLEEIFAPYGKIRSAKIMKDENGKSKGFGFICFSDPEEAKKAIEAMHLKMIDNRPLYVALAQSKEERKKLMDQQTYNNTFRASMILPNTMPLMYPPPGGVPYPPTQQFQRFPAMPNRPQGRGNVPQGMPSGQPFQQQVQVPRPNYAFQQNGNFNQNFRPRGNMGKGHPMPHGQRPPFVTSSMNHIASENVRPRREEIRHPVKQHQPDALTLFKDRLFNLSKNVFSREKYEISYLNMVVSLVTDLFTNSRSDMNADDKELSEAIMSAYESNVSMAQTA